MPQSTVGAVALDNDGIICVVTSTGGLTNKLSDRIGDTPMAGAGFWAEEWMDESHDHVFEVSNVIERTNVFSEVLSQCLLIPQSLGNPYGQPSRSMTRMRSIGLSGTGNGDPFISIAAARTAAAMARFKPVAMQTAVAEIAGLGGELQRSAGSRWRRTGEGMGGMVGIEVVGVRDGEKAVSAASKVVADDNCTGMFRA